MLVELDVGGVAGRAVIVGPERGLRKAHPVEGLPGPAVAPEGQLLGIAEGTADALHVADGAACVTGGADVAGREGPAHRDAVADGEARGHQPPPSPRFSTSAMRRPSSSEVMTPVASRVFGDRGDPALVVAHRLVGLGAELLDAAAELIHGDDPPLRAREQHHEGVGPLLPERVRVLRPLDAAGGQPAHVVDATRGIVAHAGSSPALPARVTIESGRARDKAARSVAW